MADEKKYDESKRVGEVTLEEMKQHNLPFPDPFGDNVELARFINKKFGLKYGEFDINYVNDDTNLVVFRK